VRCILQHELTRVCSDVESLRAPHDGLSIPDVPDVVVLDRQAVRNAVRALNTIRRRWATAGLIVVNAPDERAVVSWLDLGADDACSASSTMAPRLHAMARRARAINAVGYVLAPTSACEPRVRRDTVASRSG
jgi:DNA-binding response OmpR family regulator